MIRNILSEELIPMMSQESKIEIIISSDDMTTNFLSLSLIEVES